LHLKMLFEIGQAVRHKLEWMWPPVWIQKKVVL